MSGAEKWCANCRQMVQAKAPEDVQKTAGALVGLAMLGAGWLFLFLGGSWPNAIVNAVLVGIVAAAFTLKYVTYARCPICHGRKLEAHDPSLSSD